MAEDLKYISLFSGIGGFDLGFDRAGMECVAQVEIDIKAREVLTKHWPDVPKFEDVKEFGNGQFERGTIDLICGGFPCQDLSIAGRRAGLAGERSGLWFEFARVIDELEPRWVVVENVSGLLSSNRGRDFAVILRWLVERGYGVCWRVYDAQYFGVPQRRRRVFVVASLGSGRSAEVLFESKGMYRDTPPSRETGEGATAVAGTLSASGSGTERPGGQGAELDFYVPVGLASSNPTTQTLMANYGEKWGLGDQEAFSGNYHVVSPVVWDKLQETSVAHRTKPQSELSHTLNQAGQMMYGVRRFTPTECERLQGFPDGWTDGQADTARYKQLGNAVAVPCAEWIGNRISKLEELVVQNG